jgi:small subunit ribosomal protein S6
MTLYENIFIGRQDLSQQQMEALGVSLCLFVTQNGGKVVRGEYCGFRWLAYPVKKNRKGHYYIIQMQADGALIAELNRIMKINEDIVRHLIVKVDEFLDHDNLITQAKTLGDESVVAKDAGYRNAGNKTVITTESETEEAVEAAVNETQE